MSDLRLRCSIFPYSLVVLTILHYSKVATSLRLSSRATLQMSTVSAPKSSQTPFQWERNWYAVHAIDDVVKDIPTKVTLLEQDYVLWKQNEAVVSAFIDRCPHRLAPLSEGRIETKRNTLQCSYHGWEFTDEGKCTKIPQLPAGSQSVTSPRGCLTRVPVSVRQGIVFIWPDVTDEGLKASESVEPTVLPDLDYRKFKVVVRDLPYGYDTLVENLLDASHAPFAHHGVLGDRNNPRFIDNPPIKIDDRTFVGKVNEPIKPGSNKTYLYEHRFTAPNFGLFKLEFGNIKGFTTFHFVPTKPGFSRLISQTALSPFPWKNLRWVDHLERNAILDGDAILLHQQERFLRQQQTKRDTFPTNPSTYPFFTPAPADAFIQKWRAWLRPIGQPTWALSGPEAPLPPMEKRRDVLLDRLNSHTKTCSACRGAYKNFKNLLTILDLSSNVLPFVALTLLATAKNVPKALTSFSSTTIAAGVGVILKLFALVLARFIRTKFEFSDYVHTEKK